MNANRASVAGVALLAAVLLAACSTEARRVDCERRLQPINRPAPLGTASPAEPPSGERP
jgi:hypothetical protein